MDKKTKILIGILIVLIILLIVYLSYIFTQNNSKEVEANVSENEVIENETTEENTVETDVVEEDNKAKENEPNTQNTANSEKTNNTQSTVNSNNTEVVGKEEQESNSENKVENPEETAIKLAKEKWGETSKNYVFTVDQIENNVYHIAVVSNAQVIGYVDVNMNTKTAVER